MVADASSAEGASASVTVLAAIPLVLAERQLKANFYRKKWKLDITKQNDFNGYANSRTLQRPTIDVYETGRWTSIYASEL